MIRRIAVDGFRSLRKYALNSLGHTNILVGPNNAGKSNVLKLLSRLSNVGQTRPPKIETLELSKVETWQKAGKPVRIELSVDSSDFPIDELLAKAVTDGLVHARLTLHCDKQSPHFELLAVDAARNRLVRYIDQEGATFATWQDDSYVPLTDEIAIKRAVPQQTTERAKQLAAEVFLHSLGTAFYLQAMRTTKPGGLNAVGVTDGSDAIGSLSQKFGDAGEWSPIDDDLREVLGSIVGREINTIQFNNGAPRLQIRFVKDLLIPMEDYGTGISELFLLLGYLRLHGHATRLLMVEEPEAHLHPSAAALLIRAMRRFAPKAQIFVTSHSSALLDATDADWRIYRVSQDNERDPLGQEHKRTRLRNRPFAGQLRVRESRQGSQPHEQLSDTSGSLGRISEDRLDGRRSSPLQA